MKITIEIFNRVINEKWGRARIAKEYAVADREAGQVIAVCKYLNEQNTPPGTDPLHAETGIKEYKIAGNRFKFAAIADTHAGSRVAKFACLEKFVDYAVSQGVDLFFHSGDWLDGTNVYKGQQYEQEALGYDEQLELFKHRFPFHKVKKFYFVDGNHDHSFYKTGGHCAGRDLVNSFTDDKIEYLGTMSGMVRVNGVIFDLWHGGGSAGYSKDYKLLKRIESYQSGHKPRILLTGHWHTSLMMTTRNVTAFHVGCFQGESAFTRQLNLNPTIGGWIVEVLHEGQEVKSIKSEFVNFYENKIIIEG
jgi:predicted phosphodiesterase